MCGFLVGPNSILLPAHMQVFLTAQYLAIAMEYAAGGDMFEHVVKKGGLKESEARWFFQQLIVGVDYIHRMVRFCAMRVMACLSSEGLNNIVDETCGQSFFRCCRPMKRASSWTLTSCTQSQALCFCTSRTCQEDEDLSCSCQPGFGMHTSGEIRKML